MSEDRAGLLGDEMSVRAPRLRPMCCDVVDVSDPLESLGFVFSTAENILRWHVLGPIHSFHPPDVKAPS